MRDTIRASKRSRVLEMLIEGSLDAVYLVLHVKTFWCVGDYHLIRKHWLSIVLVYDTGDKVNEVKALSWQRRLPTARLATNLPHIITFSVIARGGHRGIQRDHPNENIKAALRNLQIHALSIRWFDLSIFCYASVVSGLYVEPESNLRWDMELRGSVWLGKPSTCRENVPPTSIF